MISSRIKIHNSNKKNLSINKINFSDKIDGGKLSGFWYGFGNEWNIWAKENLSRNNKLKNCSPFCSSNKSWWNNYK